MESSRTSAADGTAAGAGGAGSTAGTFVPLVVFLVFACRFSSCTGDNGATAPGSCDASMSSITTARLFLVPRRGAVLTSSSPSAASRWLLRLRFLLMKKRKCDGE